MSFIIYTYHAFRHFAFYHVQQPEEGLETTFFVLDDEDDDDEFDDIDDIDDMTFFL